MIQRSKYVTHLISGLDNEDAYIKFSKIIYDCKLKGSGKTIKGGHICICFTESNPSYFHFPQTIKYKPFGVIFHKPYIYSIGARRAIYANHEDYELLPSHLKWRYQLHNPPEVDFTWENEVRLQQESLQLDENCILLVPNELWRARFQSEYNIDDNEQDNLRLLCPSPKIKFSVLTLDEIKN